MINPNFLSSSPLPSLPVRSDDLVFDACITGINATSKKQVLQTIAWKIGRLTPIDMTWLADQLLAAESSESSGIGQGVALPHLKSTPLQQSFLMMVKLAQPVDFDSIDGQLVDIVGVVLSPPLAGTRHLQLLSRVTRLLREPAILDALRAADTTDQMAVILNPETKSFLAA